MTAPRRAVAQLAEFLIRHVDWLAAHHAAGEVTEEVGGLMRAAGRVIDPVTRRRVPISGCVEPGCSGELTAVVRPQQPQVPAEICCDADTSHRWLGHQWLQLSRRIGAAGRGAAPRSPAPATRPAADVAPAGAAGPKPRTSVSLRARAERAMPVEEPVRWVTAADITRLWAIPSGSVYRHASTAKWRRRSHSGRTYYHGSDVDQTLSTTVRARG